MLYNPWPVACNIAVRQESVYFRVTDFKTPFEMIGSQ